ncbi:hypothetical protein [Fervidibacillus halotolerans]|uniref:Uncharacterized protein n=1 Tax=Fervidibacillus halotolerans TaxID=2980027 RepID=A0A9E8RY43_9BACI|nr:hypothetical protein [Fervidibacillus halotolerans]WAA12466.1 hypothetical protein OE105_13215 [Fervidibacillus halotolerans]
MNQWIGMNFENIGAYRDLSFFIPPPNSPFRLCFSVIENWKTKPNFSIET